MNIKFNHRIFGHIRRNGIERIVFEIFDIHDRIVTSRFKWADRSDDDDKKTGKEWKELTVPLGNSLIERYLP